MASNKSDMIRSYIDLRDARSLLKKKYTVKDSILSDRMKVIEGELLDELEDNGLTSMKTVEGIAFRTTQTRYWAPDRIAFEQFAVQNDALGLFEGRLNQTNMRAFIAENPDIVPPVAADSRYKLTIRRGKSNG